MKYEDLVEYYLPSFKDHMITHTQLDQTMLDELPGEMFRFHNISQCKEHGNMKLRVVNRLVLYNRNGKNIIFVYGEYPNEHHEWSNRCEVSTTSYFITDVEVDNFMDIKRHLGAYIEIKPFKTQEDLELEETQLEDFINQ